MRQPDLTILDNPAWQALDTIHRPFALGSNAIRRYPAHILPFFACKHPGEDVLHEITPWMKVDEKLYMIGVPPPLSPGWTLHHELDCVQMICRNTVRPARLAAAPVTELLEKDRPDVLALINLVQPGYFKEGTPLLGRYFGIRLQGRLIAITGERLRLPGLTEISAVCTHPDFTGRGYAQLLMAHVCNQNLQEGCLPFLHVVSSNTRAIRLYELLGFATRKNIPFRQLIWQGLEEKTDNQ